MMITTQKTSRTLNILLWTAQILLAAGFIWAAFMKICQPAEKLAEMWPWTVENPQLVKLTGIFDLLAGIGIMLRGLTIYAAYGTVALMIAAGIFHISRGEASQIGINIFFFLLAVFIIWGRSKKAPPAEKQLTVH